MFSRFVLSLSAATLATRAQVDTAQHESSAAFTQSSAATLATNAQVDAVLDESSAASVGLATGVQIDAVQHELDPSPFLPVGLDQADAEPATTLFTEAQVADLGRRRFQVDTAQHESSAAFTQSSAAATLATNAQVDAVLVESSAASVGLATGVQIDAVQHEVDPSPFLAVGLDQADAEPATTLFTEAQVADLGRRRAAGEPIPEEFYETCHFWVNAVRAREGLPALRRWREMEACSDEMSEYDNQQWNDFQRPHAAMDDRVGCRFREDGGSSMTGQNSCPQWDNTAKSIMDCTIRMWEEKEDPGVDPDTLACLSDSRPCGHYFNMRGGFTGPDKYNMFDSVACGFYVDPEEGTLYINQNFGYTGRGFECGGDKDTHPGKFVEDCADRSNTYSDCDVDYSVYGCDYKDCDPTYNGLCEEDHWNCEDFTADDCANWSFSINGEWFLVNEACRNMCNTCSCGADIPLPGGAGSSSPAGDGPSTPAPVTDQTVEEEPTGTDSSSPAPAGDESASTPEPVAEPTASPVSNYQPPTSLPDDVEFPVEPTAEPTFGPISIFVVGVDDQPAGNVTRRPVAAPTARPTDAPVYGPMVYSQRPTGEPTAPLAEEDSPIPASTDLGDLGEGGSTAADQAVEGEATAAPEEGENTATDPPAAAAGDGGATVAVVVPEPTVARMPESGGTMRMPESGGAVPVFTPSPTVATSHGPTAKPTAAPARDDTIPPGEPTDTKMDGSPAPASGVNITAALYNMAECEGDVITSQVIARQGLGCHEVTTGGYVRTTCEDPTTATLRVSQMYKNGECSRKSRKFDSAEVTVTRGECFQDPNNPGAYWIWTWPESLGCSPNAAAPAKRACERMVDGRLRGKSTRLRGGWVANACECEKMCRGMGAVAFSVRGKRCSCFESVKSKNGRPHVISQRNVKHAML